MAEAHWEAPERTKQHNVFANGKKIGMKQAQASRYIWMRITNASGTNKIWYTLKVDLSHVYISKK